MGGERAFAKIRKMSTEDLPEVLGIERVSFPAPWTQGMFEGTLASAITNCLVIERHGHILGYIVFYFAGPEAHIMNIAVFESVQTFIQGTLNLIVALPGHSDLVHHFIRDFHILA